MRSAWVICYWLVLALPSLAQQESAYFQGKGPVSTGQLVACLRAHGLGTIGGALQTECAPGVRLASVNNAPGRSVNGSRFGGRPSLPAGVEWPAWQGTNLMFLAQVNLQQLQAATPRPELPAEGLLLFFYDLNQSTSGFDPKDKGSWRVIHAKGESALANWPAQLPAEARLPEAPMRFQTVQTLPAQPHKLTGYQQLDEKSQDRFDKIVYEFLERNKPMHQLLGHAVPIQNAEMALECQLVSHGLYCGDARGYNDPRAEKLARSAADWLLLAMIDTDEPRGWMWGDGGCLYFWIRRDDLQARRFDNVWMIMQCY